MKYSIVLPTFPKNNFDLLCRIVLPLYKKFLNWEDIYKFYLVTPARYAEELRAKTQNFKVEIIEEELLLNPSVINSRGWFKQQLLKLNISSILETEHYLVLDDDLFLIKPLGFKDFFNEDLIIYSHEKWPDNGSTFGTNTKWWKSACDVLNYDISNLQQADCNMSVTPQVLKKEHSLSLIEELKKINKDWMYLFDQKEMTEFTSYWVHLLKNNIKDYTPIGNKLWELHLDINVICPGLSAAGVRTLVDNALSEKRHFFFVIQSYLNYPTHYYEDLFLKILP